ncbi:MAG TPA: hypothetical protein VMB35_09820 [Methanomicrobiales archaeon]|nr:hypothetical protein [Methanomicrobiales archaeon]
MTLLLDAVAALEETAHGSGCEDGVAALTRKPDAPRCQYDRGATLEASFGGFTAHLVTGSPVQTQTRLSSLFGQDLTVPEQRTAALGIVNAVSGFLCLSRKLHACDPGCYGPCLAELRGEIGSRRIFSPVEVPVLSRELGNLAATDASGAEVIIITGEALVQEQGDAGLRSIAPGAEMLLPGPSTAGVAALLNLPHWCPYGR